MKIKRLLSIVLSLLMVISMIPVSVFADETEKPVDTITNEAPALNVIASGEYEGTSWTLDDNGTLTISGTGEMMRAYYEDSDWYKQKDSVVAVVVEEGITSVCSQAFYGYYDNLVSVSLPSTITHIDSDAFFGCRYLEICNIPASVTHIGSSAFGSCYRLKDVQIPAGLQELGDSAFSACRAIESVTIPAAITEIPLQCFDGCESLKEIKLHSGVTVLGQSCFRDCAALTELDIPASVQTIGPAALASTGLVNVVLPEGITEVAESLFTGCENLVSVYIPNSVTSIGEYAFNGCDVLPELNISAGVTSIGEDFVLYAGELKAINVDPANAVYSSDENGVLYNKDKTVLVKMPEGFPLASYEVPTTVTEIADYGVNGVDALCDIKLPDGLKTIGDYAFSGFSSGILGMYKIDVPDSVTSLGRYCFSGSGIQSFRVPKGVTALPDGMFCMSALRNVDIHDGVVSIGDSTFDRCNFTYVTIPAGVTSIADDAFMWCDYLNKIFWEGDIPAMNADDSVFDDVVATCYYPYDNPTYTEATMLQYGGALTWVGIGEFTGLTVDPSASKLVYLLGEELDTTGLVIELTTSNGVNVPLTVDDCEITADLSTSGKKTVTVTWGDFSASYNVGVHDFTTTVIDSTTYPTTPDGWYHEFSYDETFTYEGADELHLKFNNIDYQVGLAIYDGEGNLVWKYDYDEGYLSVRKTLVVPGDTFRITFTVANSNARAFEFESIAAIEIGHVGAPDGEAKAPSCTEEGYEPGIAECDICGQSFPGKVLPIAHDEVVVPGYPAGCQTEGLTDGSVCSICGVTVKEQVVIDPLWHEWEDLPAVAPTCTEPGYEKGLRCYRCGIIFDHAMIPATGHKYVSGTCEYCGEKAPVSIAAPVIKSSSVANTGKIKLTWAAVEGAAKYRVYRATSKTGKYSIMKTVEGTSYINSTAKAGTRYYYYVVAIDANGNVSEKSNIVNRVCDLPRTTVTLSNVASSGKIKVAWTKVDGAAKYQVYRSTTKNGTYKVQKTTTSLSWTDTNTTAGKTYYYKVKAVHSNTNANSALTAYKSRMADLKRPTVSITTSSGKPKVSWAAVTGAKEYKIYRSTSKTGTYKAVKTTTAKSWKDTTAKKGKTYYYKVVAVHKNSSANSAYSTVVSKKCTK